MEATSVILLTGLQGLLYLAIAPLAAGGLCWAKARLQGRQGPRPYQPYLDLWKLLRRRPVVPETSSWVFSAAPFIAFGCYALLGFLMPVVWLPGAHPPQGSPLSWPLGDLLAMVYLLGLARFVMGLAGMDSGAPFGGLGSGREMFMHFLAEPTLVLIIFALALFAHATSLPGVLSVLQAAGLPGLFVSPPIWLIALSLALVTLLEAGRIPFDNPATHLELTMIGKAIHLEYAGYHLALIEWAEALRLTFFLTLVLNLFFPYLMGSSTATLIVNVGWALAYPLKLSVLLFLLAGWEMIWAKLRLRAVVGPAGLALVLASLAVVVVVLRF